MALSDIDKLLDQMTLPITKCIVTPNDNVVLKLLQKIPDKKIFGRSLSANIPVKLTPPGSFGLTTENTGIPAGIQSTSDEGSVGVKKLAMSLDFTGEQLKAMEGGREGLHETMEGELKDAMKAFKARQGYLFCGRGDGVVARASGATTTETTVTSSTPIFAIEGDMCLSFTERDTATGGDVTTAVQVVGVNHEAGTIEFASAFHTADNTLLALSPAVDQSSTKWKWPSGLQAILDNPKGLSTAVMYDADDVLDADFDHVDTYLGFTRATMFKANCITYNAGGGVLDEVLLSMGAAMAMGAGQNLSRVAYLMNPKMFRRVLKYFAGKMEVKGTKIELPGGDQQLPTITTAGAGQTPIIQSYYIPDGLYMCVGMDDFEQLTIPGSWMTIGGSKKLLVPDGTGLWKDAFRFSYIGYWNTFSRYPWRQVVVYNLSVAD